MLERIRNHLILNSTSISDLSLYHGKMGIFLFFYHYAKFHVSPINEDFAWELLNEITDNINESLLWNMEYGLIGIMWGIEYLYQNNFLEGDSSLVLNELEQKLLETNYLHWQDTSLDTGLAGLASYLQYRVHGLNKANDTFLKKRYNKILKKIRSRCTVYTEADTIHSICNNHYFIPNIQEWNLGLRNGCAGYGLKAMKVI